MEFILIFAAIILSQNYTPVQAAPSIESCPPDSILSDDACICNPESCVEPPCLSVLSVAVNGSDLPGSCCPIYECVECKNDTLIDGKCPCAPEAVLNSKNQCECVDEEKHLVNGKCICNPLQCKIPELCDRKSVPVTVNEGCCATTICKPCPSDSESTNVEGDLIDDHCVCLPCKNDCGKNEKVVVKKYGSGFPGNCCDLYECKKSSEIKGCYVGDIFYENGKSWFENDDQECKCQNGLSLCSIVKDKKPQSCFGENRIYKHLENWTKEDGCTLCGCNNGEVECISHFCEAKVSQSQNYSQPCSKDGHIYQHLDHWTEKDDCTYCTCIDGVANCTKDLCDNETNIKKNECQPLANCNKTCINGFKINKKGCEICKCNSNKFGQDILNKYNITMQELLIIVDNYMNQRTSTSTTSSTTTTSTTTANSVTASIIPFVEKNAKLSEEPILSSTTTEPAVVPTDKETSYWNIALPIFALLSLACVIFIIVVAMCVYKSRRKSSMDLSHCQYETVNNLNNNNTIKKTEQLL